jgi:tetratricopeptide (TPR) repeat protein
LPISSADCESSHVNPFPSRLYDEGVDFTAQAYSLGWCYAEMGELETAMSHFQRGYKEALSLQAAFQQAKYEYAMGFVLMQQENWETARQSLEKALQTFVGESFVMVGACLNLLAAIYESGSNDLDKALDLTHNAFHNLSQVDNPVHMHHVMQSLAAEGYPVGSGTAESGVKQYEQRLGGAVMRWSRTNLNRMIGLRSAAMARCFDQRWAAA